MPPPAPSRAAARGEGHQSVIQASESSPLPSLLRELRAQATREARETDLPEPRAPARTSGGALVDADDVGTCAAAALSALSSSSCVALRCSTRPLPVTPAASSASRPGQPPRGCFCEEEEKAGAGDEEGAAPPWSAAGCEEEETSTARVPPARMSKKVPTAPGDRDPAPRSAPASTLLLLLPVAEEEAPAGGAQEGRRKSGDDDGDEREASEEGRSSAAPPSPAAVKATAAAAAASPSAASPLAFCCCLRFHFPWVKRYSFLRRSFSLAGSGAEEGAEEVEVEEVVEVEEAAALAVAAVAALGFLGPRAVFDAAAAGAASSPAPLLAPAPAPAPASEDQEGEETEANCRRAIKAFASGSDDDDDDAFEASQRPITPAFAAPLAPWIKLM